MPTHTPSPMTFLSKILKRPNNEKPFVLLVAGYPANNAKTPVFAKQKNFLMISQQLFNLTLLVS